MRNVYQPRLVSRRTRLLTRTALSGALLGLAAPALAANNAWIGSYYGSAATPTGVNGSGIPGAPVAVTSGGVTDITLNRKRTLLDYDYNQGTGLSDFHPTSGDAVNFRFGDRDWVAVVRSAGRIEIDGAVQTLIGNSTTVGGNLWLLGGQGVLFTGNARVDVGGLLATTASLADLGNALDDTRNAIVFQNANQSYGITAQKDARITGHGGTVALIAPTVLTGADGYGYAQIAGVGGTSILYGAARSYTVNFAREAGGDFDLLSFEVDFTNDGGSNLGSGYGNLMTLDGVTTTDGNIYIGGGNSKDIATAVISARGTLTATNASNEGGNIVLSAGGNIVNRAISATTANNRTTIDLGDVTTGDRTGVTPGGDIRIQATGSVTGGTLSSAQDTVIRAGRLASEASSAGTGYGLVTDASSRGGGIKLVSVTSYGDLLLDAVNGQEYSSQTQINEYGIDLVAVRLAGMAGGSTTPLDFSNVSDAGHRMLLSTRRDGTVLADTTQGIAIGGPGGMRGQTVGGLTTLGDARIVSAANIQVDVQGDVRLDAATAWGIDGSVKTLELRSHTGSVNVANAQAMAGNLIVDAATAATVGTGRASYSNNGQAVEHGVLSVHGGTTASLTTGIAAGDVYVVSENGNATAVSVTAGDDIFVRAKDGAARLTTGIIDNTVNAAADIDGGSGIGYAGGSGQTPPGGFPLIPGFTSDADNNGRLIQVEATGVDADAYLGLDTGGVSLRDADANLDRSARVLASRDAIIGGLENATTGARINIGQVIAGRDATVRAITGNLSLGSVEAGRSADLRATAGNLSVNTVQYSQTQYDPGSAILRASGSIGADRLYFKTIDAEAGGDLAVRVASSDSLNLRSGGMLSGGVGDGYFDGYDDIALSGQTILLNGALFSDGNITLAAPGGITSTETISAGGSLLITAGASSFSRHVSADGGIAATFTGNTGFADVTSDSQGQVVFFTNNGTPANSVAITVTGGALSTGVVTAAQNIALSATGALTLQNGLTAGGTLTLLGGGAVQLGGFSAGGDVSITGQTISLASLSPVNGSLFLKTTGGNFSYASMIGASTDVTIEATGNITTGNIQAGDDIRVTGETLTLGSLRTTGSTVNDITGANITLAGTMVNVGALAAYDDLRATALGTLALATAANGTLSAGRDIELVGNTLALPATIAGARDLSITRTSGNFDAGSGYSAARDLILASDAGLTVGAASAGRDLRLFGAKVTVASLMTTRDLSISAGSGGVNATTALNPGRDLSVTSSGDATFTTVTAGDDIRVTSGGKVTAASLTSTNGPDSEPDGRNIFVVGASTAIGSATAPNTVSITPAPPAAPTPTPTPTPTPVPPAPPPAPWAQASYGGIVNGSGAATATSSASMLDITLNSQRSLFDFGTTNGISDFRPSTSQGVTFHYGDRSWIAIVRSTGQIQVDGALRTVLGNTDAIGGSLWLLSNAGVLFGANARVDVGGLMASASTIATIADTLDPTRTSYTFGSAGTGGIVIQGGAQLRASGGALVFAGPSVTSAAGSTVTGTNGASVLYAATGPATVNFARAANGDLTFASANGSFATGAVNVAGTTTVDGSATLGGTAVSVGTLNTGGAVTMLATTGNVAVGTMVSRGAATFDAANKVVIGDATATDVRVVAADLDVNTRLAGRALQIESRGGDIMLGGDGTATGFALANADFGRIAMTSGAAFYAGQLASQSGQAAEGTKVPQATPARGNLTVTDLDLDPAKMPTLGLYADTAHTVAVVGAVKPTVTGGIVQIGDALAAAEWKPGAIAISGGFGSAIVYNEKCFDQVISLAELRLNAVGNIVFGDAAFQTAVNQTAAAAIDVARGTPTSGTGTDHIFAITQKLTIGAGGKVAQQNTSKTNGAAIGLILANQDSGTDTVLSVSGGPTALDLFGSIIDQTGTLRSGINAAAAAELKVSGGVKANFRFNGCALASAASCSKLDTSAVSAVKGSTGLMREVADDDSAPVGGN